MPYRDTCDRCLTEESPAIEPAAVTPNGTGAVLATYLCPTCGTKWTCGWAAQDEEPAA